MSHNKITIDNQASDSAGNIPVNISSYITETTPSNNDVLKYDGANWVNGEASALNALDLRLGLFQYSGGWGGGSYYYGVGDYYTYRKATSAARVYFNNTSYNNATSANTPQANTKWMESVDINDAGKYLFIFAIALTTGTSITVRMSNNAGEFGAKTYVRSNSSNSYGAYVVGISDCVANDIFKIVVKAKSGSVKKMDDEEAWMISHQIYKLS